MVMHRIITGIFKTAVIVYWVEVKHSQKYLYSMVINYGAVKRKCPVKTKPGCVSLQPLN